MPSVSEPATGVEPAGAVRVGGQAVPYRLRRSTRARRAAVHIHPRRGLEVVLPVGVAAREAKAVLAEQQAWLDRHATAILRAGRRLTLGPGTALPYRGQWLRLSITPAEQASVEMDPARAELRVHLPQPPDEEALRRRLTDWYRGEARRALLASVERLLQPSDGPVRRMTVRDQATCWGSCSSKGRLSFNWRLVMAPPAVLDAVVAHELLHLTQPDHSAAFWSQLDARFPRHRACRRWLDANAYRLTL